MALDRGEWLASCQGHFASGKKIPGTKWTAEWVSRQSGSFGKQKFSCTCQELNSISMLWH